MKKLIVFSLCIMLVLSVVGCGAKTNPNNEELTDNRIDNCIDTASLDIDNDGVYENCSMTYGPTSGLFTVVITASVKGTIKYKNTFNLAHGELSFKEKDGIPQLVKDGEYHRLFVEDNRIVIENLDTQYGGYWGDSEWNYDLK